ncbi:MAG: SRPBCC family protein [Acidimicrobiales bacterium]
MPRYSDTPTVEVRAHIAASADFVWHLLCDVNFSAQFSNEFVEAEWLDGATGPALGVRFRGTNRHPAIGEWQSVSVITECEPGRALQWSVGDPEGPAAVWRFDIAEEAEGVLVTQKAQMGPGPSGLTGAIEAHPEQEERIVDRRLDEYRINMQANLDGIRALAAEAPGTG